MLFQTTKDVSTFKTFEEMRLKEQLLRGIYAYGMCAAFLCRLRNHKKCLLGCLSLLAIAT